MSNDTLFIQYCITNTQVKLDVSTLNMILYVFIFIELRFGISDPKRERSSDDELRIESKAKLIPEHCGFIAGKFDHLAV